jgi:hypothetical protein
MTNKTLTRAQAYVDTSDRNNPGWAFRLSFDDGSQESGPLDVPDDHGGEAMKALAALVKAHGGKGKVIWSGEEGIAYVWHS